METRTVFFPTMACGGCAAVIRRVAESVEGVRAARASVADKLVSIDWEPPATWEAIAAALGDAGHPPAGEAAP